MSVVIEVENLYKQYRLGTVNTGTFSHDLNRWWHRVRGKQDPYEMVTSVNAREEKGISEYVWALEDINFKVNQGEVLGIIGRNGAGKSTLLKLLSKVTAPTKGNIRVKGRIASLLEVGTGFHPELTGRENIFLNGAILGMSKTEIKSKFDEIVDFSGVEKYIDTPVKRYSSGMYVRLAFGVAAHLEPEILIVDEVLAVGDAEFQKKCLGKMKDVSGQGRTVLFVSHNMVAMNSLCKSAIFLERGKIKLEGPTPQIISEYLNLNTGEKKQQIEFIEEEKKKVQILSAGIFLKNGEPLKEEISLIEPLVLKIKYKIRQQSNKIHLVNSISNIQGNVIYFMDRTDSAQNYFVGEVETYETEINLPNPLLKTGKYFVSIYIANEEDFFADSHQNVLAFELVNLNSFRSEDRAGFLYIPVEWPMKKLN
jgi:lipopolysaccharide transport system ATP-binding protein